MRKSLSLFISFFTFIFILSLTSCQEVTAPQEDNVQYLSGNIVGVQYDGAAYGFGSFNYSSTVGHSFAKTAGGQINCDFPSEDLSADVEMIISTVQNVTRSVSYNVGTIEEVLSGDIQSVDFSLIPGEQYYLTFKVNGMAQALPVTLVDESGLSFELTHAVYAAYDFPNGGMVWMFSVDKLNDGTIKVRQQKDNRDQIYQVAVIVQESSSLIEQYPDLIDELPDFDAATPPSFQNNYSDYVSTGLSIENPHIRMTYQEMDGKDYAYYSFLALETTVSADMANLVRVFTSAHPITPKIGISVGLVEDGQVVEMAELNHLFNRDYGSNNSEYVNTWGIKDGHIKVAETNIPVILGLDGFGDNGGDDDDDDDDDDDNNGFVVCETIWTGNESVYYSSQLENRIMKLEAGDQLAGGIDSMVVILQYGGSEGSHQENEECKFEIRNSSGDVIYESDEIMDHEDGQYEFTVFRDLPENSVDWKLYLVYTGPEVGPNSTHVREVRVCRTN